MKFERISENMIKIIITSEDLQMWDIDIDNLANNTIEAQNLFSHMLKQVETETDFFDDGCKLIVEAVPTKCYGFVMIITKVSDCKKIKNEKHIIFEFESFEDVVDACKNIQNRFVGKSSLYKGYKKYYLVLDVESYSATYDLNTILTEFGRKVYNSHKDVEIFNNKNVLIKTDAFENINMYF